MGSPIALFNLINTNGSSHDLTPNLKDLLQSLYQKRNQHALPWRNFIHPGDPIAWPLEKVVGRLLDGDIRYIDIADVLTPGQGVLDFVGWLLRFRFLSLINGGNAHGSYWTSRQVAEKISALIQQEVAQT